jgi:hypothetical protein
MPNLSDDDSSDNSSGERLYSSDSSEASSITSEHLEEGFYSASEEFFLYNYNDNVESVEPIATEQEATAYAVKLAQKEEEEDIFWSRFPGEENVETW